MNLPGPLLDPSVRRLAVMRLRVGLGDLLASVPALRSLRSARPDLHVALITWPEVAHIVERQSAYIDELIPFPGYPGIPERKPDTAAWPAFVATMRGRRFDLALQAYGRRTGAHEATIRVGARWTGGFSAPGQGDMDPRFYLPYPTHLREVERHLALFAHLGVPPGDDALEFPVEADDRHQAAGLLESLGIFPGEYTLLHPGATAPSRRWLPERFAAVGDRLAERGLDVLVTGSANEEMVTAAVVGAMEKRAVDLCGRTSLGALAALLETARLLVTNDTGPAHLAAALGVSTVTVFQAGELQRWAAPDRDRHVPVQAGVPCQPCSHQVCPIDFRCASGVAVGDVAGPALRLLQEAG